MDLMEKGLAGQESFEMDEEAVHFQLRGALRWENRLIADS